MGWKSYLSPPRLIQFPVRDGHICTIMCMKIVLYELESLSSILIRKVYSLVCRYDFVRNEEWKESKHGRLLLIKLEGVSHL